MDHDAGLIPAAGKVVMAGEDHRGRSADIVQRHGVRKFDS